jgi:hypothetical protein
LPAEGRQGQRIGQGKSEGMKCAILRLVILQAEGYSLGPQDDSCETFGLCELIR